jgi:hypothetical protein
MSRPPNPFAAPLVRPAPAEVEKFMAEKPENGETVLFPQSVLAGSVGELAYELADGTEVPEEFYFATALTLIGSLCAERLRLSVNLECEPRLYTVLLGTSSDVKKSTALRRTIKTLLPLLAGRIEVLYGVGSAEGLARVLSDKRHVLLAFDEMKSLFDKCKLDGSSLLAMIASFFEGNRWSNPTKNPKQSIQVNDGHLSIVAACTLDTYGAMWTPEGISIGLPNRLFIVSSDRHRKVAWPREPDLDRIEKIVRRIQQQLDTLPRTLGITSEAKACWEEWYMQLTTGMHAKRLDALGFRLMQLLALTYGRQVVDRQTVGATIAILDYELWIRQLTDPIDAENRIARVEEKIRRTLAARGPLNHRQLLQFTNANRTGLWAFEAAIANLMRAKQVILQKNLQLYSLAPEVAQ